MTLDDDVLNLAPFLPFNYKSFAKRSSRVPAPLFSLVCKSKVVLSKLLYDRARLSTLSLNLHRTSQASLPALAPLLRSVRPSQLLYVP